MANKSREKLDFLVLLHSPEGATDWPHPVTISVHPRGVTTLLHFSVGHHIVNVGGQVPIDQVIFYGEFNENFTQEFDSCEGWWLVPYLKQLASGESVTATDLIEVYKSKFGHPPKVEWSYDLRS